MDKYWNRHQLPRKYYQGKTHNITIRFNEKISKTKRDKIPEKKGQNQGGKGGKMPK